MDQSQLTRIVEAVKGTSRFSDTKTRIDVSNATTRDVSPMTGLGAVGLVMARAALVDRPTVVTITDTTGNLFALLDVDGAADGATLS